MKICDYINQGKERISAAGLECADPLLHMRQIVAAGMGWSTTQLYLHWEESLTDTDRARLEGILARRLRGEPYQYIVGEEWFWKSRFEVGPGVLIPRRETELLVETVLQRLPSTELKIAELGPGSGNIGIACLLERPSWEWHAYEKNPETWPYLERNLKLISGDGYRLHRGDFFEGAAADAPFDALVANPPYVKLGEWPGLSKEVRSEPKMALDGGVSGMEIVSRLVRDSVYLLKPGGIIALEIGSDQEAPARQVAAANSFADVEVLRDYSGLPRVLWGKRS